MTIVRFEDSHTDRWDEFCLNNPLAWFWHTSYRIQHALDCSFSIKSANHSFFLEENGRIAAIAPLTVDTPLEEGSEPVRQMSYGGFYVPAPVVSQDFRRAKANAVYKTIFSEIDRIAAENGVTRLVMRIAWTPGYDPSRPYVNFLARHGFNDISLSTQVIDLRRPEDDLFEDFDENHRRAVRKGEALLALQIYDHRSITKEVFENFQRFYFKAAGKATRPQTTFDLLHKYLRSGLAIMGVARHEGRDVGCATAVLYKKQAIYFLGANEPGFEFCPVAHAIQWDLMRHLKAAGIEFYETGTQRCEATIHDDPSEKDKGISRFKRGFGGVTLPLFIGEKFYSTRYMEEIFRARVQSYGRRLAERLRAPPQST